MLICLCFFGAAIICAMKSTRLHASLLGGKLSPYYFDADFRSIFIAVAVIVCVVLSPQVFAAGPSDLNSLENRFFEHTYPQDTTEDRLTRLEKMVFGEARTGDDQSRLQQLMNAVPAQQTTDNSTQSQTASQTGPDGQSNQSQASNNGSQSGGQSDDSDTASGTDYPRVTELEKVLLGKTYQGEPIKHRLDQLELKSFGKTHSNEDLADRVDRIAQYADKKFNGNQNSAFYQSEPRNGSIEQKVAWLETQIEGQAFPQKPMIERLRPLEKAMFPTDPTDIHASIPEQVNMLMSAVELLHKQQTGQASGDQELNIAPLIQNPQQQQQMQMAQQAQTGYARHNNYNSDLQREFEEDNGPAPIQSTAPNYSANYRPQQAYGQGQPSYTQSQGYGSQQPAYTQQPNYNQQTQATNNAQKSHGHPFFRGLAKALGEVGSMVGAGMMQGGMYGGYGGYGNYGYGGVPGGAVFGFP